MILRPRNVTILGLSHFQPTSYLHVLSNRILIRNTAYVPFDQLMMIWIKNKAIKHKFWEIEDQIIVSMFSKAFISGKKFDIQTY